MGETEVTQGLWEAVWGTDWPGTDPDGSGYGAGADYPAYYVSWFDAVAFCNLLTVADDGIADTERVYCSDEDLKIAYTAADAASGNTVFADWGKRGYRLPTEAEWEYSARYVNGVTWKRGDHASGGPVYTDETDPDTVGDYAWYSCSRSNPVSQKKANALGLRDMGGNVQEWCYDWYAGYAGTSATNPSGPASGTQRVYRGGNWNDQAYFLQCAYRMKIAPSANSYYFGFRLCRTAD